MRTLTVLLLVGAGAAVAACGGGGPTAAPSTQPTLAPTVEATALPTATATATPTPTPTPMPTPTVAPGIGELYTDPEGVYQIRVDPEWTLNEGGFAEGIEFWFLGPAENGFTPNLNVVTQRTGGLTLDEYTKASIEGAPAFVGDFELLSTDRMVVDGVELAVMEYTGTASGNTLHFLAVFTITEDRAVVATVTTPLASFESWRAIVEPYLRTLRPA